MAGRGLAVKEELKEIPKGLWGITTRKDEWAEARRSLKILFVVTIVIITILFFAGVHRTGGAINTLLLASIALAAILFVILWWYAILLIIAYAFLEAVVPVAVEGGFRLAFEHWRISLAVISVVVTVGLFWWLYRKRKARKDQINWQLEDQLRELKERVDTGVMAQEEYERKKKSIEKSFELWARARPIDGVSVSATIERARKTGIETEGKTVEQILEETNKKREKKKP